jgi:hypothetical protein
VCQAAGVAGAVPEWVTLSPQQLTDCGRLATEAVRSVDGAAYETGVVAAVQWILGTAPSPCTGSGEAASRDTAEQEFFVAGMVELGDSPLSATVPAATAQGVGRTLAWLLG